MDIDITLLAGAALALNLLIVWLVGRVARQRGRRRGPAMLLAAGLGLLPPLNVVYLLVLRGRRRTGDAVGQGPLQ